MRELEGIAEYLRFQELDTAASWVDRAGDHIEFLETQAKVASIDAVAWDDRKQILDVFQDTKPGTITMEGGLYDLYDKLLAVARWGAQQAFDLMTIDQRPDEPVTVAVAARSTGRASAMVDQVLSRGQARGIEVSVVQPPMPDQVAAAWEKAASIAEGDAVGVTLRDVNDFGVVSETGSRIAFNIRARAQKEADRG